MADSGEATMLLQRAGAGDGAAASRLLPLVYQELHDLARHYMAGQRPGHTLQPTALVHEAWLKLVDRDARSIRNRAHFVGLAARAMRSVLVDHARARVAEKRGGQGVSVTLDDQVVSFDEQAGRLIQIDEALEKLGGLDAQLARIVELRFFAGLTIDEAAAALEVSTPTIERGWRLARAWLQDHLEDER